MISSNTLSLLQWWLIILLVGTSFLPLTFKIFSNFFDKGYIFSKTIGIVFLTYIVFLSGIVHLTSFNTINTYAILFFLALFNVLILNKDKSYLSKLKKNWLIFTLEEIAFLAALSFWTYIRAFNPEIHGLEKFMDFGFINSMLRSEYFPPKDMWLTPFSINYYYFGHLATAVLTRLANLPSNITFNLMLSTLFSMTLIQSFSLGANLYSQMRKDKKISDIKRIIAGILSASLITLSGNLHILYAFFIPYESEKPVPFWDLTLSFTNFPNSYWYPNATRFIYHTIHEFPIYSWVVADLHGHVLDIPFVILTIAILLSLYIRSRPSIHKSQIKSDFLKNKKILNVNLVNLGTWNSLLIGFLLAIMYMTNAWDGAIYLLLSLLIVFLITGRDLYSFAKTSGQIILSLFIFSLPYNYFFKPFASGIGVLCSPEFLIKIGRIGPFLFEADHCQHSPWWQLLTLYGFFYFFVIIFLFFLVRQKKLLKTDIFILLLIVVSTLLIIVPEFIYLKDIYPAHFRANTMFKLVFQSFIMLSLSSSYIIIRITSNINKKTIQIRNRLLYAIYLSITMILLALVMIYPILAIKSYYGIAEKNIEGKLNEPVGLDGITYLQKQYFDDYQGILWINKNIKGQPVILEAQGDSYTDYARISSNTGLPTVLGWTVHEWLWRGSYEIPGSRVDKIRAAYEELDTNKTKDFLQDYDVEYVFVGALERDKYPNLNEEKFLKLGSMVYQSGETKIYKINSL